ncbi:MAG: cytidylate kinase [Candidatus Omnitrophica bacterium CG07_land_8_20_14_0_80_42_15]|uniref:Cytidylate kinase n=1 Tax=Candidatus Aquitaenariimonas noxiae TaxID=1974741 RepID=A0A2J0L634_9BACT|nr:MAG: cytidylate kinase [Candidatus Omnitrophica bacterium CG07_land_8_20_14_0_80_42_15]
MKEKIVIAIDGPAGSGKSTVSKIIAKRLDLLYLDTGAMYRALTLKTMRLGIDLEDADRITKIARETNIKLTMDKGGEVSVFLDEENVSKEIRTPAVTKNVKYVACIPGVRRRMAEMQRGIAKKQNSVLEGRDIGTVVLPQAPFKFYLDAKEDVRSTRRFKELKGMGMDVKLDEIKNDIQSRDASDMNRELAPLKKAPDAIYIDTTNLSIEEVVEKIISLV